VSTFQRRITFVGQGSDRAQAIHEKWPAARMGSLVIVMNLGLFAPVADVRLGMEQVIPLRGYDEVTLPGTPEHRGPVAGLITNQ